MRNTLPKAAPPKIPTDTYIWVIAGGFMQMPLIREIKRRGYRVLISDRNPDAPGGRLADQILAVDTYDITAHVEIAEQLSEKPAAVLTAGADVGPTVSAIAEVLGLPAERLTVARRARNKIAMRKTIQAINPHPFFLEIDHDEEAPNNRWKAVCKAAGIQPYPCILKPPESSGTRGVSLIRSPWDWPTALHAARVADAKRTRRLLIEEWLSGPEYALDFFVSGERLYLANAAARLFYRHYRIGIEAGHVNPWSPPPEARALVRQAAHALGASFGPFKIDLLNDRRYGWCVMECATRLSGGLDHAFTSPLATGRDITGTNLDLALGRPLDHTKLKVTKDQYACAYAPIYTPGQVADWELPDHRPGLQSVNILAADTIMPLESCADRPIFVIAIGDSPGQAIKRAIRAAREVRPVYV